MDRPLSVREVARLAETSASTVSRALSGRAKVSQHVAQRIMKVVRETGFTLNGSTSAHGRRARGLVHKAVTIVDHDVGRWDPAHFTAQDKSVLIAECDKGAFEVADAEGLSVSLCLLAPEQFAGDETPPKVRRHATDGFLAHSVPGRNPLVLARVAPTVIFPSRPVLQCCCPVVEPDDGLGVGTLVRHLFALGHRRLGFVASDLTPPRWRMPFIARLEGFRRTTLELECNSRVFTLDGLSSKTSDECARQFTALPPEQRPTALVCANDATAICIVNALGRLGVRVPQDVSITGYDGMLSSAEAIPALTTWRPDWRQIGAVALKTLLAMIAGETVPSRSLIGGELIEGSSVGPPAE